MRKRAVTLKELLKMDLNKVYFNKVDTSSISLEVIVIKKDQNYIGICNSEKFERLSNNKNLNSANKNDINYIKELTYKLIYCIIIDIDGIPCLIDEVIERYISGGKKMIEENDIVEFIEEEGETYSDDDLYNINSWGVDYSFRELVTMYDENDLIKPELQRKYVWTKNEASRFIDSILLGLPVPSIFLAKTPQSRFLIVDGYQRIMTVHDFINGLFGGDGKSFKLSNTDNINKRWRNKTFAELSDEEKRRIKTTAIHAIIFEQKYPTNDTAMYQIFERINTGGKTLRPQEIRNCVYQGKLNSLLFELNVDGNWRNILDSKNEDARMGDIELILRFFAILNLGNLIDSSKSQIVLSKFLNDYMGSKVEMKKKEIEEYKKIFREVMEIINSSLGNYSFRKLDENDNPQRKINASVFESVSIATKAMLESGQQIDKKNLKVNYISLLNDEEFVDICTNHTTRVEYIHKRIEIAKRMLFGI